MTKATPTKRNGKKGIEPRRRSLAVRRFAREEPLGAGGLCRVDAATDLLCLACGDGAPRVALKSLLPEYAGNPAAERLLAREFFVARGVAHPGVARVYDLHRTEWGLCLSMELLEGSNLHDRIGRRPGGVDPDLAPLAGDLFAALACLHGLGIAHGDVKPANLSLEGYRRLVLFDFNTAEVRPAPGRASAPVSRAMRSSLNLAAYSPLHAAPERMAGGAPDFADDVFAACCTVYELVEGAHPFLRKTSREAQRAGMAPKPPAVFRGRREALLLRGLSFDPARRPTAAELARAFAPPGALARLLNKLHT